MNFQMFDLISLRLPSLLRQCASGALAALAFLHVSAAAQGVTVSESGQGIYSMPIAVPPGVGGMEPKLSLVYNSGGINGPVGVGWAVQGFSQITRCGQLSRGSNNKPSVKAVNLDANDALCLDGQRLIKVTSAAGSWEGVATSDQSNAAQGGVSTEFRTEIDGFSRIRASGAVDGAAAGPATFVVESKAGLTSEYGRFGGSDEGLVRVVGGAKNGVASAWLLRRVKDTVGNTLQFHYEQTAPSWGTGPAGSVTPGREWNLVGVSYGCNANVTCNSTHVVKLSYADRADKAEAYHFGSKVVSTKLLNRIEVRVGAVLAGNSVPTGGTLVRAYKLAYQTSPQTSRNVLASIAECSNEANATDNCLPPNTFRYSGSSSAYYTGGAFNLGSTALSSWDGTHGVITGDFNGDGKTDLIRWDKRSGNASTSPGVTRYTNALWLADAKVAGRFNPAPLFNQALSTTTTPPNATNSVSIAKLGGVSDSGPKLKNGDAETHVVDINGDGRSDLVVVCKYLPYCGPNPVRMWLSLSDVDPASATYGVFREIDVPNAGPREFSNTGSDLGRSIKAPFSTGNGRNLIECGELSDGGVGSVFFDYANDAFWQDFNGDGMVDLVSFQQNGQVINTGCVDDSGLVPPPNPPRSIRYYQGRGDGSFELKQETGLSQNPRAFGQLAKSGLSYVEVMDINADGRPDVLFTGSRFLQNASGTFDFVDAALDPNPQHPEYRMLVVDANGDGKPDVITVDPDAKIPDPGGSGRQVSANPYTARLFVNKGDGGFFRDDRPIARINSLGQYAPGRFSGTRAGWMSYGSGINGSTPIDYNGDGQTDFLSWMGSEKIGDSAPTAKGMHLLLSKGSTDAGKPDATLPGISSTLIASHGLPQDLATGGNSFSGGDFLGVGNAGFIKMGNNGGNSMHARLSTPPDLLELVTSPTRLATTIRYSSTGMATKGVFHEGATVSPAVYQNVRPPLAVPSGTAALTPADLTNVGTYPIYYAHPAQWMVSRTDQSGLGSSSNVTTAFVYRGMAVDLSGGGNLGFEAVSKYFPYANGGMLATTSEYLQDPDQRQYQGMPRCTYTLYNPSWVPNQVQGPVDEEMDRDRRRGTLPQKTSGRGMVLSKPIAPSSLSVCSDTDVGPVAGAAKTIAMTTYVYGDVRAQTATPDMFVPTEIASLVKRPYQRQSTERKWDLNDPTKLVSKVVNTNTEMTAYGDVLRSNVSTTQYDARLGTQTWTKETTNNYDSAGITNTSWLLGRLSRSTARSTTPTTAPPALNTGALSAQQRATQDPALTQTPPLPPRQLTAGELAAILQLLLDE
jgi:Salmonella virulence plasmid 65kDa B protein/FG-GAP-like repeat